VVEVELVEVDLTLEVYWLSLAFGKGKEKE
jgi:hypothetical protein